jgi:hypothetical protein
LSSAVTDAAKDSARLPVQSPSAGTIVWVGFSAWKSEPELYPKMSVMSPVDSRVLTMLSPSPPCGRCSTSMVTSGFASLNASARPSAMEMVVSELSTRKDSVTLPSSLLPPPSPPPQAVRASELTATPATTAVMRRWLMRFIDPPLE